MFGSIFKVIRPFLTLGLETAARWIASRIRTGDDERRARLISYLVDGVVAELMARYPGKDWVFLVEEAIRILQTAVPSFPTESLDVMRRAVSSALLKHGVQPPVS